LAWLGDLDYSKWHSHVSQKDIASGKTRDIRTVKQQELLRLLKHVLTKPDISHSMR
jgi:hypothetical protein